MTLRALLATAVASSLVFACGTEDTTKALRRGTLPPGVAARVGEDSITIDTVSRISRTSGVPPVIARERAVSDAIFARGARDGLSAASVAASERAALARATLEVLAGEAAGKGPPSDQEIARLGAERWVEFERPEAVRTAHAVVIVQKPEHDAPAKRLAQQILDAVKGSTDPKQFVERAGAVPRGALDVRTEELPFVTADGRTFDADGRPAPRFSRDFAGAAHALRSAGELSPVVETEFGYHVILLVERLPPKLVPIEERRRLLTDEALRRRTEAARRELVASLTARAPVERSLAASELTAKVSVLP